jgi:hypothetical protein
MELRKKFELHPSGLGATHPMDYKGDNWEISGDPNPHYQHPMENLQQSPEAAWCSQDHKKL